MNWLRQNIYALETVCFVAWGLVFGLLFGVTTGNLWLSLQLSVIGACVVWVVAVLLRATWRSSDMFFRFCMCCVLFVPFLLLLTDLQMKLLATQLYSGTQLIPYAFFKGASR